MKWVEVNIGIQENREVMRDVLLDFVVPLVERTRSEFESWHFLWEGKPWPEVTKVGVTLRLRFYGDDDNMAGLKKKLENELNKLEKSEPQCYLGHCFGRHGDCEKEYEGEDWGTEGWQLGMKLLKFGSEVALKLIKNGEKLGKSEEFKLPIEFYADRYVHCFLNNIFNTSEEIDFYLREAIQRISHSSTGKQFGAKELKRIMSETRNKIVSEARSKSS